MTIRKLLGTLYVQVLIAIALGVLIGHVWPQVGIDLKRGRHARAAALAKIAAV